MSMSRKIFLSFMLLGGLLAFSEDVVCGYKRNDFKEGEDIVGEIRRGNFYPLIEDEGNGSMRVKNKYKTPEIKEALYQLLVAPPKGFIDSGEGLPRIYLLRIMGDIQETRAIPYLIECGDNGVAMSLGRMGEAGLKALSPELKKNKINRTTVVALAEMVRKGDVGYISDEKSRQDIKEYLKKAVYNSDEIGKKYAVRGLGEYAIQGDTEAIVLLNKLATTDPTLGKTKNWPIRMEASKMLEKLKNSGGHNQQP